MGNQYDTDPDHEEPRYVHPNQTAILPGPTFAAGQLGPCFWCGEPAEYGNLDLGGKRSVDACRHHYEHTVAPAFAERERKREETRIARAAQNGGKKKK